MTFLCDRVPSVVVQFPVKTLTNTLQLKVATIRRYAVVLICMVVVCTVSSPVFGQLSPFKDTGTLASDGSDLPEILPPDLIDPATTPRQTTADKIAGVFNRNLRDIEEAQSDIIAQLDSLPRVVRETQRVTGFGYHDKVSAKSNPPKWVQIDMGESVSPDAVALFPVTAEVDSETIYGYGFPKGFRVEISNDVSFQNAQILAEGSSDATSGARRWPYFREVSGASGRYIRVSAFDLWRSPFTGQPALALSEVMILKGGMNLAVGKEVSSRDSEEQSDRWSERFVTDGITTLGIPQGIEESPTLGFRARSTEPATGSWVQVDLGEAMKIDQVEIILADAPEKVPDPTVRFPYPMRIETSEHPDMRNAELLGRYNPSQISVIGENPLITPVDDAYGRYVRISVQGPKKPGRISFDLAEVIVYSGTVNVALGKPVKALHPFVNEDWSPQFLVDNYSSRRKLTTYEEWLSGLSKRNLLVGRWLDKEEQRLNLVDQTVTRGVSVIGAGMAAIIGFVLVAFSRGRVQRRKDLEDLRQRIASDLHDDIGSNLSSIALLAELGKMEVDEPDLVVEELTEIKSTADKTIESMRDIVWLIRPGEETWQQMLTRFRETAAKLLRTHEYTLTVHGEAHGDRLPLEFKRDIFLIYKEVLNNIIRHANAENVKIEIDCRKGKIQLLIEDDGDGFNNLDKEFREGNGLRNLRMRAQAIGGNLKVRSTLNEGTSVRLTLELP